MSSDSILPLYMVDAFADAPFKGNPAAVVPLETWLPDETLQAIAQENNLSETAFFIPSENAGADFDLRWFTPSVEVPLCGHATLATGHTLYAHLGFDAPSVRFSTREKGILTLSRTQDTTYGLALPAAAQQGTAKFDHLGQDLGLTILEIYEGDFLMLVLPEAEAVARYQPDFAKIKELDKEVIITAPGGYSRGQGRFKDLDFVSRMFAPNIGIDEDPVTGAAHAQLIPYWTLALQRQDLSAAQIGPRSGTLSGRMEGSKVVLEGQARTYASGQIYL